MRNYTFDEIVEQMHGVAGMLVEYTYPINDRDCDWDILPLKERQTRVDGYDVRLVLSKARYDDLWLETLQIWSEYSLYLPFNVVVKIARKFFGDELLSLNEILLSKKKRYCWSIFHKDGKRVLPIEDEDIRKFEDFCFNVAPIKRKMWDDSY